MAVTISGTLTFWNDGEEPQRIDLERVEFAFVDTYEPSLIVEEVYEATVQGRTVRYGEFDGVANGYTIRVVGFGHAGLSDWVRHGSSDEPGPDFVDTKTLEVRNF